MAGRTVVCITVTLYIIIVAGGYGDSNSFRRQEEYVKEISSKGRDVESTFQRDPCLNAVLADLRGSCSDGRRVQDQKQRNVFAFRIFNCYANLTFKPESKCTVENVSACIDDLVSRDDGEALEVYKHLDRLLQVDNLCVAVQEVKWQQQMDNLIDNLLQSSAKVVHTLKEGLQQQEELKRLQDDVLVNQEKIMEAGQETQKAVDFSHKEMNQSFSSVFTFIGQQRQLMEDMFHEFNLITDSISFFLRFLQGEVSFIFSILFVALMVFVSYEVTTSTYTRPARPWLFVLCGVDLLLETVVSLLQLISYQGFVAPGFSLSRIRYPVFLFGLVVVGVSVFRGWKRKSSRNLLLDLSRKVEDLKRRSSIAQINTISPIKMTKSREEVTAEPTDVTDGFSESIIFENTGNFSVNIVNESSVNIIDNNNKKADFEDTFEDFMVEKGEREIQGEKEQAVRRTLRSSFRKDTNRRSSSQQPRNVERDSLQRQPIKTYNLRRKTLSGTPVR